MPVSEVSGSALFWGLYMEEKTIFEKIKRSNNKKLIDKWLESKLKGIRDELERYEAYMFQDWFDIIEKATCPERGLYMLEQIFTLIVTPLLVGVVIELVSHWLDEKDDNW